MFLAQKSQCNLNNYVKKTNFNMQQREKVSLTEFNQSTTQVYPRENLDSIINACQLLI